MEGEDRVVLAAAPPEVGVIGAEHDGRRPVLIGVGGLVAEEREGGILDARRGRVIDVVARLVPQHDHRFAGGVKVRIIVITGPPGRNAVAGERQRHVERVAAADGQWRVVFPQHQGNLLGVLLPASGGPTSISRLFGPSSASTATLNFWNGSPSHRSIFRPYLRNWAAM